MDEPENGASILSPLGEWDHCSGVDGEGDRENLVWRIPMVSIQLGSLGSEELKYLTQCNHPL
jgi:hypothetical protein